MESLQGVWGLMYACEVRPLGPENVLNDLELFARAPFVLGNWVSVAGEGIVERCIMACEKDLEPLATRPESLEVVTWS